MKNNVLLLILDGWGLAEPWGGNAIAIARTPYFDYLWKSYPRTELKANGTDVGLPGHEMGNSEVGHLNIGAGRIVRQDILHINEAINSGEFFKNDVLLTAMRRVKNTSNNLHLMGLLSDGGIHGHIAHALALLYMASQVGLKNVYFHIFTDGRDTSPLSAQEYISRLQLEMGKLKTGRIATISGRYYAMDRNKNWSRTNKAYQAMVSGSAKTATSAMGAVANAYTTGQTDEFINPTIILSNNKKPPLIKNNDSVIFWNFRSDRARQIMQAFIKPTIEGYDRTPSLSGLFFVSMIPYGVEADIGVRPYVAFEPKRITTTLASTLAKNNIAQLHIAETEKYAHVTYFLNGTVETPYPLEDRILVPSPAVVTYDLQPEMSAPQITEQLIKAVQKQKHPFIVANYANLDMVGHTGNFAAVVKACECVDEQLRALVEVAKKNNFYTLITADHGNAEQIINPIVTESSTEHTKNKVPFIIVPPITSNNGYILRTSGRLSDIAPTVLGLLGIEQPDEMTGKNLIAINRTIYHSENDKMEN